MDRFEASVCLIRVYSASSLCMLGKSTNSQASPSHGSRNAAVKGSSVCLCVWEFVFWRVYLCVGERTVYSSVVQWADLGHNSKPIHTNIHTHTDTYVYGSVSHRNSTSSKLIPSNNNILWYHMMCRNTRGASNKMCLYVCVSMQASVCLFDCYWLYLSHA